MFVSHSIRLGRAANRGRVATRISFSLFGQGWQGMKIIIQEREGMKMEIHEVAERNENKKTVRGEWKGKYR